MMRARGVANVTVAGVTAAVPDHGLSCAGLRAEFAQGATKWIYEAVRRCVDSVGLYKLRLHYIYTSQDDKITSDACTCTVILYI